MPDVPPPTPVGEPMLRQVLLCDRYMRARPGMRGAGTSLPGHLIQFTTQGRSEHEVGGRHHLIVPGSLVWFHEDESVQTHVLDAPWSFYTVNFIAPALEPPPFDQRVRQVEADLQPRFDALLGAWRGMDQPPVVRALRVHAALSRLLADVLPDDGSRPRNQAVRMDDAAGVWWDLERRLRQNLAEPVDLHRLTEMTGKSPATLTRACRAAVGAPPMKRLKHIRMSLARGLVQRSDLSITQIAERVGYARLHELSRDYRKHFGLSPRADRQRSTR